MYDDSQISHEAPVKKRKNKKKLLWLFLPGVLVIVLLALLILPAIRTSYTYTSALMLFEMEQYEQAAEKFSQLPDQEQMVKQCYYWQGEKEYSNGEYEEAVEFFTLAGDYENADEWLEVSLYDLGHTYFLQGQYDEAQACFDRLDGVIPEGGALHFARFDDAVEYFRQQAGELKEEMGCFVGQMPSEFVNDDDALWKTMGNYIPFRVGGVEYMEEDHYLAINTTYYPGNEIIYAWQTGDDSVLDQEEKEVMALALSLVEQAQQESETEFEVQLWLYNWLCEHIAYDSPEMNVPPEEHLKLRQLTCVGALLDGKANCQGYTDAFYLLGTLAGFDVCRMGGTAEEAHCWNGIMLDGKCYIVDVTFGDVEEEFGQATSYTWFNCSFDPSCYSIDGGAELFPALVMENDLSQTYYTNQNCVFDSLDEAALYLMEQYKEKGEGWAYAMIPGCEVTSQQLYDAFSDNVSKAGVRSLSWTEFIETYAGNTYLSIRWE